MSELAAFQGIRATSLIITARGVHCIIPSRKFLNPSGLNPLQRIGSSDRGIQISAGRFALSFVISDWINTCTTYHLKVLLAWMRASGKRCLQTWSPHNTIQLLDPTLAPFRPLGEGGISLSSWGCLLFFFSFFFSVLVPTLFQGVTSSHLMAFFVFSAGWLQT